MGDRQRTQQNHEIVRTDDERGLIFVKGSVPGSKNGWLLVRDAVKVDRHGDAPYPAGIKQASNNNEAAVPATSITNNEVADPAADGQEG
jgi:large subunit ribosomal protein L3